jgi:sugar phosphate isomerase/epimerase
MTVGCCSASASYGLVVDAGFDFIEVKGIELSEMTDDVFRKFLETIQNGRIPCKAVNGYCNAKVPLVGPSFDRESALDYAKTLLFRAHELGASLIGVGAPFARTIPDRFPYERAFDQFSTAMKDASEVAASYGIKVMVEPLSAVSCNFLCSLPEVVGLVAEVDCPNLTYMFDFYHSAMMDENWETLEALLTKAAHVHVSSCGLGPRTYITESDRNMCGVWKRVLAEAGYDKAISLEVAHPHRFADASNCCRILKDIFQ